MPRMTDKQFMEEKRTSGGGNFLSLKKEGQLIGWIHPKIGFYIRSVHPTLSWNENDEKGSIKYRGFNCGGEACPLCVLKEWAKEMIESDSSCADDIVLSSKKGKKETDLSMSDLAGEGDWTTKITDAKKEYAICWIPYDEIDSEKPYKILEIKYGLFFDIKKIIDSKISDEGEQDGNPLKTPWAMKLVYDKDAKNPNDYYSAFPVSERKFPYNDEVKDVLDAEPSSDDIDLDRLTEDSYYGDQFEALNLAWYEDAPYSFADFQKYFEGEVDRKILIEADERRDERATSKKKEKKGVEKKTKSTSKNKKRNSKKEDKTENRTCDECGEDVDDGVKFCPSCGSSVRGAKTASDKKPTPKKGMVHCEECDEFVKPTKHGRCTKCGMLLDMNTSSVLDEDVPL